MYHALNAQYEQIVLQLQAPEGIDSDTRKTLEAQKLSFEALFNLGFPLRSLSFSIFVSFAKNQEKYLKQKGEYVCPELGITGEMFMYGGEKGNDQLLKDFQTLCEFPGMDLHSKDENYGQTPLELAKSLEMDDAVKILEEAIAKQGL
jgi:hypothetical protein